MSSLFVTVTEIEPKNRFLVAILAAILNSKGNSECLPILKCSLRFLLQLLKAAILVQKVQYTDQICLVPTQLCCKTETET